MKEFLVEKNKHVKLAGNFSLLILQFFVLFNVCYF